MNPLAPVRIIISFCPILYQINNITATIFRIYPMAFGSLATIKPTALNTNEVLYTAPTGQLVEGKVYITNRSASEIKIRVGLSTGTVSDFDTTRGYVVFNRVIPRGGYYETDSIYFGNGELLW
jgi:hypothetical protein